MWDDLVYALDSDLHRDTSHNAATQHPHSAASAAAGIPAPGARQRLRASYNGAPDLL